MLRCRWLSSSGRRGFPYLLFDDAEGEFDLPIEKSTAISRYRKLTMQSAGWLVDILSDANGVSFHRFQLFSWTVILGGVFASTRSAG